MIALRPTHQDRDALQVLLARTDLNEWGAEFVETLRHWQGAWTERQACTFDALWAHYYE